MKPLLNYNTIGTKNSRVQKGGFMLIPALLATALTACPQAPVQEQQINARGMTSPKDIMLHGIIAGSSFQSNQGFTLQNGSSIHANTGLILNSRNIVLNGGQVSSTSAATCSDNSGQGFCLNGKPKFISPIITVPKPDVIALKAKYTAVPVVTIQGSLNLNSSSEITSRFDNKIVLVKGSVNLNAIATIKNAVLIIEETLKSNKGITFENSRIISKGAQFNQSTVLTNSRIVTDEDLSFNGKFENTGISSVISSKNLTTNQSVTSTSGELAVIANQNITVNQSVSGKIAIWASGNVTLNQVSSLEGSVVAGGKVTLNQGVTLTKVLQHLNGDMLGGGIIETPFETQDITINQQGGTFFGPGGVKIDIPQNTVIRETQIRVTRTIENPTPDSVEGNFLDDFAEIASDYYRIEALDYDALNPERTPPVNVKMPIKKFIPGFLYSKRSYHRRTGDWFPHVQNRTPILSDSAEFSIELSTHILVIARYTTRLESTSQPLSQASLRLQGVYSDIFYFCEKGIPNCVVKKGEELGDPNTASSPYTTIEPLVKKHFTDFGVLFSNNPTVDSVLFVFCKDPFLDASYGEKIITICFNKATKKPVASDLDITIRHEMFHALQNFYIKVFNKDFLDDWILEGTAAMSELSSATALKVQTDPNYYAKQRVDSFITQFKYDTQDFWTFLGLTQGATTGLGYTKNLFQGGLKNDGVTEIDVRIKRFFDAKLSNVEEKLLEFSGNNNTGLLNAYWKFAKNQAYTKKIGLPPRQEVKCETDTQVIGIGSPNTKTLDLATTTTTITVDTIGTPFYVSAHRFNVANAKGRAVKFTVTPSSLRFVVFEEKLNGQDSTDNCSQRKDNNGEFRNADGKLKSIRDSATYLVLVHGNSLTSSTRGQVTISQVAAKPTIDPSSIDLSGTVGSSTNTVPLTISNTGDVDSILEFKRFFVTENLLDSSLLNPVPIAGAVARPQAVVVPPSLESSLIRANGFSPSSISTGELKVITANTPISSPEIPISFFCSSAGSFTRYINVVYKTGATDDNGVEILENVVISVAVTCTSLAKPKPKAEIIPPANPNATQVGQTATPPLILKVTNVGDPNTTLNVFTRMTKTPMQSPDSTADIEPRADNGGFYPLEQGQSANVPVSYDCSFVIGTFAVYVNFIYWEYNLNDILEKKLTIVPLTFTCTGLAMIDTSAGRMFGNVGKSVSGKITVENRGTAVLEILSISDVVAIQALGGTSVAVDETAPILIQPDSRYEILMTGTCGNDLGIYFGEVTLKSNAINGQNLKVGVALECLPATVSYVRYIGQSVSLESCGTRADDVIIYAGVVAMRYESPSGAINLPNKTFGLVGSCPNPGLARVYSLDESGGGRAIVRNSFTTNAREKIISVTELFDDQLLLYGTVTYEACGYEPCLK
jgi:hypothetical protein